MITDHIAWPLHGHDDAVLPLMLAVREGRGAHAYLITGPPQVGKGTLARMLAAAFCCAQPEPPCGGCGTCRRIRRGSHADVELLTPGGLCDESDHDHTRDTSRDVRICQVRRAERLLNLSPFEAQSRVVIIDPADSLNAQSADAFLKTLEEPPEQAAIILVAGEPWALPDTVRSRCREVALRAVPATVIERVLREERGAQPEQASLLARMAGGRIGWAIAACDEPSFLETRADRLDQIATLAGAGRSERFAYAEKLAGGFSRNREAVYSTISLWIDWWRDVLLIEGGNTDGVVNVDRLPEVSAAAARFEPPAVARLLQALREARADLESNVNPRLALEALMLKAPAPVKGGSG